MLVQGESFPVQGARALMLKSWEKQLALTRKAQARLQKELKKAEREAVMLEGFLLNYKDGNPSDFIVDERFLS